MTNTSASRITIGDLDNTLTVEQALEVATQVSEATAELFEALIEHWTDDEGIHWLPLGEDLERSIPETVERVAQSYLHSKHII